MLCLHIFTYKSLIHVVTFLFSWFTSLHTVVLVNYFCSRGSLRERWQMWSYQSAPLRSHSIHTGNSWKGHVQRQQPTFQLSTHSAPALLDWLARYLRTDRSFAQGCNWHLPELEPPTCWQLNKLLYSLSHCHQDKSDISPATKICFPTVIYNEKEKVAKCSLDRYH